MWHYFLGESIQQQTTNGWTLVEGYRGIIRETQPDVFNRSKVRQVWLQDWCWGKSWGEGRETEEDGPRELGGVWTVPGGAGVSVVRCGVNTEEARPVHRHPRHQEAHQGRDPHQPARTRLEGNCGQQVIIHLTLFRWASGIIYKMKILLCYKV